jgi:cytoskeletal protein RodZ
LDNTFMPAPIGETLREARLDAGIELDEAERTIRIRSRYLSALENEDWGVLPGEAYVRGFLRTYGDYLGLDGAALVDEYNRRGLGAEPEHPVEASFEPSAPAAGDRFVRRAVPIMVVVVGALAVLFIVLAVTGSSEKKGGGDHHRHHGGKSDGGHTTPATTTTTTPTEASVTLQPTGTVWVCLVDHAGKPLVNGETLSTGDNRGPFRDRDMKLTLGNGEIRIDLNGKPVSIPSAAEPVGFDLTPQGAKPLSSTARPTCA